ncbi:WD40-like repeat-containing protein [Thermoplasmatales archaeon SCGC AB-540-F20]|nr:WD40-like repeat-containing protein [Thermoplasmatales archaeon SCGC AB-540-F20]
MNKHIIPILVILLFIITAVSPMVIGFKSDAVTDVNIERDGLLDNLAFYCYDANGFDSAKYEYMKEQMLNDYSDDETEIVEDVVQPVEPISATTSGGPMDSPWPMKCYDTHHTSRSPYSTTHIDGLEKWRFRCGGVDGSPIIGDDGTIYFGDKDREFYAIYPNGTLKWKFHVNAWVTSAPALAEDGTLYVGSWDDKLYAFNSSTGNKKWAFRAKGSISSSPAIAEDGTVYFGTMGYPWDGDCNIYAVNPNGTLKWVYHTEYKIISDPAIGDDGTVYIGSGDYYFYAMNPNGTLKWRFETKDYIKSPPSIADDGTVYIGSFDDYLYALYPNNGTLKWKCKVGYGTATNPSIANDGTIYIGGQKLYAIYPNGAMKWTFNLGEDRGIGFSSPAISYDGTIYVGTSIDSVDGSDIIAVNPDGTEKWRKWISTNGWIDSSPCIGQDGTVYIGSQYDIARGYLHAFGPVESNSPPSVPTITGTTWGKTGHEFYFLCQAIDPDNNPISYYIDWGDGFKEWTPERASGEDAYFRHKWLFGGKYTIRCKARDVLGEESDLGEPIEIEIVRPKIAFLAGGIYDYEYIDKLNDIGIKAENLRVLLFFPPSFKRYTSGEQFYIHSRIIGQIENDYVFGFNYIYSEIYMKK